MTLPQLKAHPNIGEHMRFVAGPLREFYVARLVAGAMNPRAAATEEKAQRQLGRLSEIAASIIDLDKLMADEAARKKTGIKPLNRFQQPKPSATPTPPDQSNV